MTLRKAQLAALACLVLGSSLAFAQVSEKSAAKEKAERFPTLLKQGFELHEKAQFAEAVPVLEQARKLEPRDYFVNLLLGIDLLRTGKPAEAIPRLTLAATVNPAEEFPEGYLGEAQAALGHNALAAEAYEQAVARGHDSEQSLEAWAGFALERFHQIGETLRASDAGVAVARRLQDAAKPDAEGVTASACAKDVPGLERRLNAKRAALDGEAAYQLSKCYAVIAGDASARLLHGAQDLAAVHRLRGDILLRLKGDADGARAEYQQALEIRPRDPAVLQRLAEARMSSGDTEGAQRSAQAALDIDPTQREALRTLVTIAMSQRDYAGALPWLRQLAKQTPGDRAVEVELGTALAQTGASEEALPLLKSALAAGYPDEKGALHALLARVLRRLDHEAEAQAAEAEARRLSDAFQAHAAQGHALDPGGKPDAQQ
jgi:tetratricopeptide (TPR) repeat protein